MLLSGIVRGLVYYKCLITVLKSQPEQRFAKILFKASIFFKCYAKRKALNKLFEVEKGSKFFLRKLGYFIEKLFKNY